MDVNLGVSKDGSVTLTYKSSNPNATLFCGVDAMKARLCKNTQALQLYWEELHFSDIVQWALFVILFVQV